MAHNRTRPKPHTILTTGYNGGKDLMVTYVRGDESRMTELVPMHDPDLFIKGMRHFLNKLETQRNGERTGEWT